MKKKNDANKIFKFATLGLVLFAMVFSFLFQDTNVSATNKVSDEATITKFNESLGDEASTQYSGRIWTDKSVFTTDATFTGFGGNQNTIEIGKDEDFLVAFSALATAQEIQGQTNAPLDVVFVIDLSSSMLDEMSSTDSTKRIVSLVNALNTSIDSLMNMNSNTRVAVVGFSNTASVLLELGHYSKGTYTTGRYPNQTTVSNYFSLSDNNKKLNVHVYKEGATKQTTKQKDVDGGTNIQMGLYKGMNVLSSRADSDVVVNIGGSNVNRVPAVIMLSDGAPTYSSDSSSWWSPDNNNDDGPGGSFYSGNAMKALMSGTYEKARIDDKYNVDSVLYTVGMGITGLSNNDYDRWEGKWYYSGAKDLAEITLNPNNHWNDSNDMAKAIRNAWTTYTTNNGTPKVYTKSNESFTFKHPSSNDFDDLDNLDSNINPLRDLVDGYYDADDATTVTNVFNQIVSNISLGAAEVPTEVKKDDPINSGMITYTDPIGEYMEVKDVKAILYAGQKFTQKKVTTSSDKLTTTYVFEGEISSNIYGEQNLNHICINVIKDAKTNNQTMKIEVPASVIPVRVNSVKLDVNGNVTSHTNNGTYPIGVIYSVSKRSDIMKNGYVDTSKLSQEYLKANTNDDGTINFYSNLYTGTNPKVAGSTVGDTTVEFEPSHTNPFYYMLEDVAIYTYNQSTKTYSQVKGNKASDIKDNENYYILIHYYHGSEAVDEYILRTGSQLKRTDIISKTKDGTSYLYRAAGSPNINRILKFDGTKNDTTITNTAEDFYAPTFKYAEGNTDPYAGKFVVYLGNNGRLTLPATETLVIHKDVVVPNGFSADKQQNAEFKFKVDLGGIEGTFGAVRKDAQGNVIDTTTIQDGGTVRLKNGETITITDLPSGIKYKITEIDIPNYYTATNKEISGKIESGNISNANFVNTYKANSVTVTPNMGLHGTKTLVGRDWLESDEFTFVLKSSDATTPMPENSVSIYENGKVTHKEFTTTLEGKDAKDGQAVAFDFASITYTKEGVYRYTIAEKAPTDTYIPGISYSGAMYEVIVYVEDNGSGQLVADLAMNKLADDAGANQPGPTNSAVAAFKNTYSVQSTGWMPVGSKKYVDLSGNKPLTDSMFEFAVTPIDTQLTQAELSSGLIAMKAKDTPTHSNVDNKGSEILYETITFTQADAGESKAKAKVYTYKFSEVLPSGVDKDHATLNGMTYDTNEYIVTVKVYKGVDSKNNAVVVVEPNYGDNQSRVIFTNTYDPTDATATIQGLKTLNGRNILSTDDFTFTLTAVNNLAKAVLPTPLETTAKGNGTANTQAFAFKALSFDKVGSYEFELTEKQGNLGGVTYDKHKTSVVVVVSDNGEGKLVANVTYKVNNQTLSNGTLPNYINTYRATFDDSSAITLTGKKELDGRTLVNGDFYFEILPQNNAPIAFENTLKGNNANGTITFFNKMKFTDDGTFVYLIKEQIPAGAIKNETTGLYELNGVTYDSKKVYKYSVTVEDDLNGTLFVSSTKLEVSTNNGQTYETVVIDQEKEFNTNSITFKNVYTPTPSLVKTPALYKVLDGYRKDGLEGLTFEFEMSLLEAKDNRGNDVIQNADEYIKLPAKVSNDAKGNVQFGDIQFFKGGTYVVSIKEVQPTNKLSYIDYSTHEVKLTITVSDDLNGKLISTITKTEGSHTFTNEYHTYGELDGSASLNVTKVFTGRENNAWLDTDSFTFELIVNDEATLQAIENEEVVILDSEDGNNDGKVTVTVDKTDTNHKDSFGNIKFTKPGTYKFVIREIDGGIPGVNYDSTNRKITVVVEDNNEGKLNVYVTRDSDVLTFTNVYEKESTILNGHQNLVVTKVLTGREWLSGDKFYFKLENTKQENVGTVIPNKNAVEIANDSLVIDSKSGLYHFDSITFNASGTYTFTVKEVDENGNQPVNANGIKYDTSIKTIVVDVVDNGKGELVATLNSTKSDALMFTNQYAAESVTLKGEENLVVHKTLSGRNWLDGDQFTFKLAWLKEESTYKVDESSDREPVAMPTDTLVINKANKDSSTYFGDITFYQVGTYVFTITEQPSGLTNVVDDPDSVRKVVINVTDNLDGTLKAVSQTTLGDLNFTNTFKPNPAVVSFTGTKQLTGRDLISGEFRFYLDGVSATNALGQAISVPMPAADKITNGKDDNPNIIEFGTITFNQVGTYKYRISEVKGTLPSVTYDSTIFDVTVQVTQGADGNLVSNVTYAKNELNVEKVVFNNTYNPISSKPLTITAQKYVTPTDGNSYIMSEGTFEFKVEKSVSNPSSDPITSNYTVKNNAEGLITLLNNVSFTEAGTYVYTVHEINNAVGGIIYDNSIYKITVTVSDNTLTGQLETNVVKSILSENSDNNIDGTQEEIVQAITFNNGYNPTSASALIQGYKKLESEHKTLESGEFEFTITAVDTANGDSIITKAENTPLPSVTTVSNTETGLFQFGPISYETAGTYTYLIQEVYDAKKGYTFDDTVHTVTVTVKDVLDGTSTGVLTATVSPSSESIQFTNYYEPTETLPSEGIFGGTKLLEGRELVEGEFEFALLDGTDELKTATNDADGKFAFEGITFSKAGEYHFTIAEKDTAKGGVTYDLETKYDVAVVVVDNGGELHVDSVTYTKDNQQADVVFNNKYTAQPTSISIQATKLLQGRDLLANEFKFMLYGADDEFKPVGEVLSQVTNDASGNIKFDSISLDEAKVYKFVVLEDTTTNVDRVTYDTTKYGYEVKVVDNGNGSLKVENIVITNLTTQELANAVFRNIFTPKPEDISVTVKVQKTVKNTGNVIIGPEDFEFVLEDLGTGEKQVLKTDANGNALFTLDFNEKDINKTFVFKLSETNEGLEGIVYDTNTYFIRVEVSLNENNELVATVTNNGQEVGTQVISPFENINNANHDPILSIEKTQAEGNKKPTSETISVEKGDFVTYYLTVKNTGEGEANNVVITDVLSKGLDYVEGSATHGGKLVDGILTWNIDTLEAGKEMTVSFKAKVSIADTTIKNIAHTTADNYNETPSNGVEVKVVPEPETPKTSDDSYVSNYTIMMLIAAVAVVLLKKKETLQK